MTTFFLQLKNGQKEYKFIQSKMKTLSFKSYFHFRKLCQQ